MSSSSVLDLQLLLVRSLIDRARLSVRDGTSVGSMTAMLLADVAVETITKTACRQLRIELPKKRESLQDYLDGLKGKKPSLFDAREIVAIEKLRRSRNLVQHEGTVLDQTMVSASVNDAESFCTLLACEAFEIDFAEVSAIGLVKETQIRNILEEALRAKREDEYRRAVIFGLAAYEYLYYTWMRAIRLADGYDESQNACLPAIIAGFPLAVGICCSMPNLAHDNQYPLLARMTLGFSVDELIFIENLRCSVPPDLHSTTPITVTTADIGFLVEVVARAAWRLETNHPGALATETLPEERA